MLIVTAANRERWIRTIGETEFANGKCTRIYGTFQDIDARKRTEIELRNTVKSLDDYRYALDESSILAITDSKGVITYINDNFCKVSKYQRTEIIGQTHKLINSGYHSKAFFKNLWGTIGSGNVWRGEVRNKTKDGDYYWVDTTIVPFLDEHKTPVQYLAIRIDITEKKEAQDAAFSMLSERNTILESIGDAFFAVDKNWVVTYWNHQAEKILRTLSSAIIGKPLWEVFSGSRGSKSYTRYHEALANKTMVQFEDYYSSGDQWFDISAYPGENGLSVYFKDITDRKKNESALQKSEEKFRQTFERISDGLVALDNNCCYTYINKKAGEINRQDPKSMIGKNIWTCFPHLVGRPFYEAYHTAQAEQRYVYMEEYYRDINQWFENHIYPSPDGVSIYFSDISLRKQAEAKIKNMNTELEKKVKARTVELELANSEMEAFSYSVSHDLRAPLRGIIGFTHILEEDYSNRLDDEARRITGVIKHNTLKMGTLIDDLLTFSRTTRQQISKTKTNSYQIIQEIIKEWENKKQGVSIEWKIAPLPMVVADIPSLRQVWINLISNAIKYSSKKDLPVIEIGFETKKNETLFYVKDNGVGFNDKYKKKLFKVFQRLHDTTEFEGTGVGLAIVSKIVIKHGGKVWAEAAEEQGATFFFTIPHV